MRYCFHFAFFIKKQMDLDHASLYPVEQVRNRDLWKPGTVKYLLIAVIVTKRISITAVIEGVE